MTPQFRRMAQTIRRELVAWCFAGIAMHWAWSHGLDRWSILLALGTLWIHPPVMSE